MRSPLVEQTHLKRDRLFPVKLHKFCNRALTKVLNASVNECVHEVYAKRIRSNMAQQAITDCSFISLPIS
jgi:hypothetical protein